MSVEVDFGITDWVGQASGSQLSWDITWPGILDDGRFAAVSFQSDFRDAQLVRVSEWFSSDDRENPHVGELTDLTPVPTRSGRAESGGPVRPPFAAVGAGIQPPDDEAFWPLQMRLGGA